MEDKKSKNRAWALLGLLSVDKISGQTIRGAEYLINSQQGDGGWNEEYFTGGGFPGGFYLKYELYKDYFPLMALAKFMKVGQ